MAQQELAPALQRGPNFSSRWHLQLYELRLQVLGKVILWLRSGSAAAGQRRQHQAMGDQGQARRQKFSLGGGGDVTPPPPAKIKQQHMAAIHPLFRLLGLKGWVNRLLRPRRAGGLMGSPVQDSPPHRSWA